MHETLAVADDQGATDRERRGQFALTRQTVRGGPVERERVAAVPHDCVHVGSDQLK